VAAHTGTQFAQLAARYIGTPYVYGGSSPSGFDCSGLIYFVLGKLGINAPRTSQAQYAWTARVSPQALKPGDLVFLQFPGEQGAGHVMIWLGDDRVLQAPQTGQKVQVSKFDPQAPGSNEWGASVVGYGRIPGLSYAGEAGTVSTPGAAATSPGSSSGGGGIVSHIPVVGGVVSGAEATGSFFDKLLQPSFWLRALEVVGGFLILMLGLYLLARQSGLAGGSDLAPPLSDKTLAELQFSPGRAPYKGPKRKPVRRHEVGSDAADRRAATKRRAELAQPSDDIPF
jgi:hypothetical protein